MPVGDFIRNSQIWKSIFRHPAPLDRRNRVVLAPTLYPAFFDRNSIGIGDCRMDDQDTGRIPVSVFLRHFSPVVKAFGHPDRGLPFTPNGGQRIFCAPSGLVWRSDKDNTRWILT